MGRRHPCCLALASLFRKRPCASCVATVVGVSLQGWGEGLPGPISVPVRGTTGERVDRYTTGAESLLMKCEDRRELQGKRNAFFFCVADEGNRGSPRWEAAGQSRGATIPRWLFGAKGPTTGQTSLGWRGLSQKPYYLWCLAFSSSCSCPDAPPLHPTIHPTPHPCTMPARPREPTLRSSTVCVSFNLSVLAGGFNVGMSPWPARLQPEPHRTPSSHQPGSLLAY